MDNTGSTSFILFDRNVSNYVGRSVQDLIDAPGQVNVCCKLNIRHAIITATHYMLD